MHDEVNLEVFIEHLFCAQGGLRCCSAFKNICPGGGYQGDLDLLWISTEQPLSAQLGEMSR